MATNNDMYKHSMTPEGNAPNKMMDYKNTRSKRANYAIKELAKSRNMTHAKSGKTMKDLHKEGIYD